MQQGVHQLKLFLNLAISKSIFFPKIDALDDSEYKSILQTICRDYTRYYHAKDFDIENIKYYPGLLATLLYRIARYLYINKKDEYNAQNFSSIGFTVTGIEIYYTAAIGEYFKITHGSATVIGARATIGKNVTLHHNVTLGDKNGGRPTLCDNITVYPGAVIVGNIIIENNVIIGANTFVDSNINENTVYKKNAS